MADYVSVSQFHRWRRLNPDQAAAWLAWVEKTSGVKATDIKDVKRTGTDALQVEVIVRGADGQPQVTGQGNELRFVTQWRSSRYSGQPPCWPP